MILTVTLNPAIDLNISADQLVFEDRAYILDTHETSGGRGINASRVIHAFGAKTMAITFSGGESKQQFEELTRAYGFRTEFVAMKNAVRRNLSITDRHGLTVKLNEKGPAVSAEEIEAVEAAVRKHVAKAKWLLLSGSLPPGAPPNVYSRLIRLAQAHDVPALLDSDSDSLGHSLEARPAAVTPNQSEAERILGRALLTRAHFLEAAHRIRQMGAQTVVLSLGARGAVGASETETVEVVPPRVEAVCPIGAGDAMAAAFSWASMKGKGFADAVRWGVAAGTASAMLPGISYPSLEETKAVYRQVEVRRAD
ncbi:MAG: 1-phosphofructokinase family hexose kinase [Bryobacter sp.]|nr:1-phosphofructokinase family hexose kinase [Bryobacter sp.]